MSERELWFWLGVLIWVVLVGVIVAYRIRSDLPQEEDEQ